MAVFSKAFSPSFNTNTFTTTEIPGIDYKSSSKLNLSNINFDKANSLTFNPIAFDPSVNLLDTGWSFITAPEDVSWSVGNQANRVDIFGTNNPPVIAGSRGMRDLTLGNSLVEGFVRGVNVESKIAALENLMNYTLNQKDGFVGVPVYQVTANDKVYGNGYFIIKDIQIKESMRDIRGNATRAYVDISLMEVPAYQVNSGRDLASQPAAAAKSILPTTNGAVGGGNTGSIANATNSANQKLTAANRAGATGPTPTQQNKPAGVLPGTEIRYQAPPR
jgi:hypothetical protein